MHWKEAMVDGRANIVRLKTLTPEMLTEEGDLAESKDGTEILFDLEFVHHTINERVLKPLGLVSPDGTVKEKFITNTLLPASIEYAALESERAAENERLATAALMARFNKLSIEENLKHLTPA